MAPASVVGQAGSDIHEHGVLDLHNCNIWETGQELDRNFHFYFRIRWVAELPLLCHNLLDTVLVDGAAPLAHREHLVRHT